MKGGIVFAAVSEAATGVTVLIVPSLIGQLLCVVTWPCVRWWTTALDLILHTYAMRMAAVFTISTATIGLRTGFLPRW